MENLRNSKASPFKQDEINSIENSFRRKQDSKSAIERFRKDNRGLSPGKKVTSFAINKRIDVNQENHLGTIGARGPKLGMILSNKLSRRNFSIQPPDKAVSAVGLDTGSDSSDHNDKFETYQIAKQRPYMAKTASISMASTKPDTSEQRRRSKLLKKINELVVKKQKEDKGLSSASWKKD